MSLKTRLMKIRILLQKKQKDSKATQKEENITFFEDCSYI